MSRTPPTCGRPTSSYCQQDEFVKTESEQLKKEDTTLLKRDTNRNQFKQSQINYYQMQKVQQIVLEEENSYNKSGFRLAQNVKTY